TALATDITVGSLVEGKAAAAPREHRCSREPDEGIGREQKIYPTDNSAFDPLAANCLASVVQRNERRRARRINGQTRPSQIEDIRYPVGKDAKRAPGHKIRIGAGRISEPQVRIVGSRSPYINANTAAGHLARWDAGIFHCVPDQLQQYTLLRIHLRR